MKEMDNWNIDEFIRMTSGYNVLLTTLLLEMDRNGKLLASRKQKRLLKKPLTDYPTMTKLDAYNQLERLTSNFNKDKTIIALNLMYDFRDNELSNLKVDYKRVYPDDWEVFFDFETLFDISIQLLESKQAKQDPLKQNNQVEKVLTFENFCTNLNDEEVKAIQQEFKHLRAKDMAILIQILTEYEYVKIIARSKTQSRKHFVHALTGESNLNMQAINSYLNVNNGTKHIRKEDPHYKNISQKLSNIVKNTVV